MSGALTFSFWLVWAVGAVVLGLLVAWLAVAAATLVYDGFALDVPPIRDRDDDRDPWLVEERRP